MTHNHHHNNEIAEKNLLLVTILNFSIAIAEIIGGLISNSLSLLSDALHNSGDAFAVLLAYIANKVSKKSPTYSKTYGFKRIEILAALFNAIVLIAISVFLFYEAYKRLINPEPIKGAIMLIVALIGLFANILAVILLHKSSEANINIKAAYLHLIGDTVSSVAVIIGGILIYFFKIYWVDPVITIILGLYIIKHTYSILKQVVNILMQGTPYNLNLNEIKKEVEKLPEISNIHHVHAWNLNDREIHFECHIDLKENISLKETNKIRLELEQLLTSKFNINHITIQFEYNICENKDMIIGK
ncbi:MAG: cation transporter [Bacteroidales bacterium]|nr:cation transporter [Bacteroidales bacterium]